MSPQKPMWLHRSSGQFSDMLETSFPFTSAKISDVAWMWLGYGSDVARMWLGCRSDVFSDVIEKVWQKLRERGFQHLDNSNSSDVFSTFCHDSVFISGCPTIWPLQPMGQGSEEPLALVLIGVAPVPHRVACMEDWQADEQV